MFVLRGCTGGARTGKLASPSPSPSDDDALEAAEEDRPLSRSKRDIENKLKKNDERGKRKNNFQYADGCPF